MDQKITIWQQFRSCLSNEGLKETAYKGSRFILRKSFGIAWERDLIMRRSLEQPILDIVPKINVAIKQILPKDLPSLRHFIDDEQYCLFEKRFNDDSNYCFAAFFDGKLAGYCWMNIRHFHSYMGHTIYSNNADNAAYFYDVFIFPEFRNNGIMKSLSAVRLRFCKTIGCLYVISAISIWNKPSLKAATVSGFKPLLSITCFSIFNRKFTYCRPYQKNQFPYQEPFSR